LNISYRQGGERLKLAWNRPGKSLKHHYQALGIPPWMRSRLPILSSEEGLLFAAGIGMNSQYCNHDKPCDIDDDKRICLRWQQN
jgi:tRNA(Ile)-lysidine synthase